MTDDEQKSTTPDSTLSEDLFQLYKEFAMFNRFCAGFCDTLAAVTAENEVIDTRTIQGVDRCCRWMKLRMEEFTGRLQAIQQKARDVD